MVESSLVVALDGGIVEAHIAVVATLPQVYLGSKQLVETGLIVAGPLGLPVVAAVIADLHLDVIFRSIITVIHIIIGEDELAAVAQVKTGRTEVRIGEATRAVGALVTLESSSSGSPAVVSPSGRREVTLERLQQIAVGHKLLCGLQGNLHVAAIGMNDGVGLCRRCHRGGIRELEADLIVLVEVHAVIVDVDADALWQGDVGNLQSVLAGIGQTDDVGVELLTDIDVAEVVAVERHAGHGASGRRELLDADVIEPHHIRAGGVHLIHKGELHLGALPVAQVDGRGVGIPRIDGEYGDAALLQHLLVLYGEDSLGTCQIATLHDTHLQVVAGIVHCVHRADTPGELQLVGIVEVELGRQEYLLARA